MKNEKHLPVQSSIFLLLCIVLKLVAVIYLPTTILCPYATYQKTVSVSHRLAHIQQILLADRFFAVLSYFLIKEAEFKSVIDFVDLTAHIL